MKALILFAIAAASVHADVSVVGLDACVQGESVLTVINRGPLTTIVVSSDSALISPASATLAENEAKSFTLSANAPSGEVRVFADGALVSVTPYCKQSNAPRVILPANVQASMCNDIVINGRVENTQGARVALDSTLGEFFPNPLKGDGSFELVIHPENLRAGDNLVRVYASARTQELTGFGTMRVNAQPCFENVGFVFTPSSDGRTIVQATVHNPSAIAKTVELVVSGQNEVRLIRTVAPYSTQTLVVTTQEKDFTAQVIVDGTVVAQRSSSDTASTANTGLSGFFTLGPSAWLPTLVILLIILFLALYARRKTTTQTEIKETLDIEKKDDSSDMREKYARKLKDAHAQVKEKVREAHVLSRLDRIHNTVKEATT